MNKKNKRFVDIKRRENDQTAIGKNELRPSKTGSFVEIDLTPEEEAFIKRHAAKRGQTTDQFIGDVLDDFFKSDEYQQKLDKAKKKI